MNAKRTCFVMLSLALAGGLLSSAAHAVSCTPGSVTISTIAKSDGSSVLYPTTTSSAPLSATSCFGTVEGNDSGYMSTPTWNTGVLGDGLLNGQIPKHEIAPLVNPYYFLTTPADQKLDLDENSVFTDPGWIYLGKSDLNEDTQSFLGFDYYDLPKESDGTSLIDDVLDITLACTTGSDCTKGTWSLATTLDVIEKTQAVLGRNAFDHLAIVLKAGKDGFAVYDFNFNILGASLPGLDFVTPYSFTGTWDTADLTNDKGDAQQISHISIWARDPLPDATVPEPNSLALIGIGILALGWGLRSQAAHRFVYSNRT